MEEEAMEEFIVFSNANADPLPPPPPPAPIAQVWTQLPVPPIPPVKRVEKQKSDDTRPQSMVAPAVLPQAMSRRGRLLKSRESSSSLRPAPENVDSVEPAAASPNNPDVFQTVPKIFTKNNLLSADMAESSAKCKSESDATVENGVLDNSGTSFQHNESMGCLSGDTTPSKPKKLHWKVKQKLERQRRLNGTGSPPTDVANGSQEGSNDDSNESMTTTDSNLTESGRKKRERKIYVYNHTPSGRKIVPTDRYSPSPNLHNSSAGLQGVALAAALDRSSSIDSATSSRVSHLSVSAPAAKISPAVSANFPSSSNPDFSPSDDSSFMPPKGKKPRYQGQRITDTDVVVKNVQKLLGNYKLETGSRRASLDQEAGPLEAEYDAQLSPDASLDISPDSSPEKKKRKMRGCRKPWNVKHAKKVPVAPRNTIRKEKNQTQKGRRRTQLDMLLDDPMAVNESEIGAQRTRRQINQIEATSPPSATQPSPSEDLVDAVQEDPVDAVQEDPMDQPHFEPKPMDFFVNIQNTAASTAYPRPELQLAAQQNTNLQAALQLQQDTNLHAALQQQQQNNLQAAMQQQQNNNLQAVMQMQQNNIPVEMAQPMHDIAEHMAHTNPMQNTPQEVRLRPVKQEVRSPQPQPPPTPQQPALTVHVKTEPDNDCVIVSPSPVPSNSSLASSAAARSSRTAGRAIARTVIPTSSAPSTSAAVPQDFAVPQHVNLEQAVEDIRRLYGSVDERYLFLVHHEVKRYLRALQSQAQ